jgi:adenylosuccinate lyase
MFGLALYSIKRMTGVLRDLEVFSEKIENKVFNQKAVQSSVHLRQLILLTKNSREDIYEVIQALSLQNKDVNWKEELSAKFPEVKNQLKDFDQAAMKAHYQEAFLKTTKRVDSESVTIKKRVLDFLQ